MAKVTFIVPIEELHGKIRGNFGAAQRADANNEGERKPYTTFYGKRKSDVTATEAAHRTEFGEVCKALKLRKMDNSKLAVDQAGFAAQSQFKTFYAYRWNKCLTEYRAAHPTT